MFSAIVTEISSRPPEQPPPSDVALVNLFVERFCKEIDRLPDEIFSSVIRTRELIEGPFEVLQDHAYKPEFMYIIQPEVLELRFRLLFPTHIRNGAVAYNYASFEDIYRQAIVVFDDIRKIKLPEQTLQQKRMLDILRRFLNAVPKVVNQELCLLRADPVAIHKALFNALQSAESVYRVGGFAWCNDTIYSVPAQQEALFAAAKDTGVRFSFRNHRRCICFDHKRIIYNIGNFRHLRYGNSVLPAELGNATADEYSCTE